MLVIGPQWKGRQPWNAPIDFHDETRKNPKADYSLGSMKINNVPDW